MILALQPAQDVHLAKFPLDGLALDSLQPAEKISALQ